MLAVVCVCEWNSRSHGSVADKPVVFGDVHACLVAVLALASRQVVRTEDHSSTPRLWRHLAELRLSSRSAWQSLFQQIVRLNMRANQPGWLLLHGTLRHITCVCVVRFRSGKLPKIFKIVPAMANWEELLWLTQPDAWSPAATWMVRELRMRRRNEPAQLQLCDQQPQTLPRE